MISFKSLEILYPLVSWLIIWLSSFVIIWLSFGVDLISYICLHKSYILISSIES